MPEKLFLKTYIIIKTNNCRMRKKMLFILLLQLFVYSGYSQDTIAIPQKSNSILIAAPAAADPPPSCDDCPLGYQWNRDFDKDTFGDPANSLFSQTQPNGYVANQLDCDDTNAAINPNTVWYRDADNDNFGTSAITIKSCLKPTGYVSNNTDCNDADATLNPNTIWYKDGDGDGFGAATPTLRQCAQSIGYVKNAADCNDADITINPNTKWYADNDLDGLGDPLSYVQQCTAPTGNYVRNNTDNCTLIQGTSSDCSTIVSPSEQNYIITKTYKEETSSQIVAPTVNQVQTNITYFDGLGRPMQQIANKQSAFGKDIITHITYDSFGRQIKEFLPYEASSVNMAFEPNAEKNTETFYNTLKYDNTTNPYSQKSLESSPLNRVLKQAAPGTSWAIGSGHEIKLDYQTNTATEVRLFKATATWTPSSGLYDISFTDAGNYAVNALYKTITYDENTTASPTETAGSTVEFKNKERQVVLKRTYEANTKHDTYYVYDQYGNLTYVIPPKADAAIDANVLNGLCYQYKYDNKNRLTEKKLPGKQWEFIVYDNLDRPVATGPASSPFKNDNAVGWIITKYDVFGRPIYTGWNNVACNSSARYTLQTAQNSVTMLFEKKETSGTIDGISVNYTNTIAPTTFKLLSVNYYDNYVFPGAATVPTSVETQTVLVNTKTLATGTWTRVPTIATANLAEINTTFYDSKSRPIRTYSTNHLGGYTYTDSKLDFTGKPVYTISKHKRTTGSTELTIREDFTYSARDRLMTHTHQINGGVAQLMADNTYDALGQLMSKKVGNSAGAPLQKIDYNYNIRGWLTEINKTANLQQSTDPLDLFAFKINYNITQAGITDVVGLYNGNISETFWKTRSDNTERAYGYQYDKLNRLKNAIYEKNNLPTNAYHETLTYDKNGNIMSLARKGDTDPQIQPIQIDDLAYTYPANSNQLAKVVDNSNNTSGFNDFNKTGDDYSYDANGNMITDKNKNITAIDYNQLNLPKKITFGTTGTIEYIYNAAGQKLEKIVTQGTTINTTNYLGGFQYKDNVLEFFPTAEGYVKNTAGAYSYVFQYKDHLGNVRVSYAKNPTTNVLEIIDENNYYPFGLKHKGYNDFAGTNNKYKYNGKELQDELGLNMYAMDVRQYDPAIARWTVIDPVTHYTESPYNAFSNNPVYFADPSGASPIYNSTTGQYVINGKQVSFDEAISYANSGGNSDGSNNNVSDTNNSDAKNGGNSTIKFPKGEDYEKKYPRLTKLAKQIHSYVKNNWDLLHYLSYYSGYSTMEVLEKLEYGKGTELQSWFYTGEDSDNNGWTPNTGNFITVNAKFVNGLEIAKRNETIQATSFLLMTTILHEFIHSSRVKNNLPDTLAEYGKELEKYGFGKDINKRNAHEYYKKNGWDFKY
ncbi:MAG: hypothetical protein EOO42_11860 [Flavobacteriales bacterium]|nr:MAG: hypothetical protein EOO42_11860 [Flavobacteriales bacterium]